MTKPQRPCLRARAFVSLCCGWWLRKKRAYVDNNLHFIKNNWKSLQTFLANMQLSGMDGKETFFFLPIVGNSNVVAKNEEFDD